MIRKWKSTKAISWGFADPKSGEMFRVAIRQYYPKEWAIFYRRKFGDKGKFVESTIGHTKNYSILNLKQICNRKITSANASLCANKLRKMKKVDYPKRRYKFG